MKVLNNSSIRKVIQGKNISIIFPPGVSEQPDIPSLKTYVSSHPDLSIYKEEPKKEIEEKVEEIKPKPAKKKKKSKTSNKES